MEPMQDNPGQIVKKKRKQDMKKNITLTGLIVTAPAALFAREGPGYGYGGHMNGGMHFWGMDNFFHGGSTMFLTTFLIIAILAFIGYIFLKDKKVLGLNNENPIDILKTRYAKGEISKDEFDEMKVQLG